MQKTLVLPILTLTGALIVACTSRTVDDGSTVPQAGNQHPATGSGGRSMAAGGTNSVGSGVVTGGGPSSGSGSGAAGGSVGQGAATGASSTNGNGGSSPAVNGTAGSTAISGMGGSSAIGSGGSAGARATTSSPNGYYVSGSWRGQAWALTTGTGSSINPSGFSDVPSGKPYCASGSVVALADYSGTATVGVNLNQELSAEAVNTVTPTQAGLLVSVTNRGGSALRLEIRGPNAATDTSQRWCAPISGSGGFIPWSSFNTACWDNSGAAYNRTPIVSAAVLVPGDNSAAVSFDVCLNSLSEANSASGSGNAGTGGSANTGTSNTGGNGSNTGGSSSAGGPGTGTGTGTSGSGTLTDQYDWQAVTRDGKNYVVQNNVWGAGASQTVTFNGTSFKVTAQSGSNGTNGAPVSYPSTFIGSNFERVTTGNNLPKQVSSIASVQTSWSTNANGSIGGVYNASYDVWFSTNPSGDSGAPSGGYLMVWFYDPPNAQPIGSVVASNQTVSGVSGNWNVWLGNNGSVPCISYVRTQTIQSMTFDLNAFIQNAVGRGTLKSNWYLSNVFTGFEIWSGGVGLESSGFYAIVN